MKEIEDKLEDEVQLMDCLQVIWKRKYLIVAGTLICAVAAGVISLSMAKVYRIDLVARPGIVSVTEQGTNVYVDSAENIKAIIEAGTFDKEILDSIAKRNSNNLPETLEFRTNIPKDSNAIKVSYESTSVDQGLHIMNLLAKRLSEKFRERVKYFQNEYKTQIGLKKTQMADCEAKRRASQRHIKNSQEQIDELTSRIELIKKNTSSLIRQRDKFLSDNTSKDSILSALLYTNTIQQNITLENTCKKQINDYITRRENEKLKMEELNGELKRLSEEIKGLEFKKNNVQNVEILQSPTSSQHPVKPRIALNVMLAGVLGFLAVLFLAFFLEYVQTHRAAIWMRKAKIDLPPS